MKYNIFNKIKSLLLAVIVTVTVFSISGCNDSNDDGSDYSFTYTLYHNPQNLDPQLATDKSSLMIIENMFLGLMTRNVNGSVDYGVASDCSVSDDGLKYTFTLKDNCYWYSAGGKESVVTAHDFVYAFKRIFNPVTRSPYREKFSFLQNARSIIDGSEDYTKLGVYAVNNTELVFYLDKPQSEFLYLLTTAPAMPCNKQFFENTNARYGLDDESVISNGPFYMTQWSYDPYGNDNLIYMKRNSVNSQFDKIYPYMLTFIIERDIKSVEENFGSSVTDCIVSETRNRKSDSDIYDFKQYEFSCAGIVFGDRCDISTELKKILSLNIDRESLKKISSSDFTVAYGIVPKGFAANDKSYRQSVPDNELGFYEYSYNLKKDEVDELNSKNPENTKIMVKENSDNGFMRRIAADWQERLDISVGVEYVNESEYYERMRTGDYFMAFSEMTTDDNSIYYFMENVISQLIMSKSMSEKLIGDLDNILSGADLYSVISKEENTIISEGLYIPVFYRRRSLECKKNISDLVFDPFSEKINFRYAKYYE